LNPTDYQEFMVCLQQQTRIRGALLAVVAMVLYSTAFVDDLRLEQSRGDWWKEDCSLPGEKIAPVHNYDWSLEDPRTLYFGALLVIIGSHAALFTLSLLGCFTRVQKCLDWEKIYVFGLVVIVATLPLAASHQHAIRMAQWLYTNSPCDVHTMMVNYHEARAPGILRITFVMNTSMTVICMYMPIRPRYTVSIFLVSLVSIILSMFSMLDVLTVRHTFPFVIYVFLGYFYCQGSINQLRYRKREWQAVSSLQESNSLREAVEKVARIFCDLVIFLDSDCHVHSDSQALHAFFQTEANGRPFTDLIATPEDVQRFTSMVEATNDAPGLISATLLQREGFQTVEAQLFISRTHKGFILGIAVTKEQLHVARGTGEYALVAQNGSQMAVDAESVGDRPESLAETSENESTILTAKAFKELDIGKIRSIGELEHWLLPASSVSIDFTVLLGEGGFGTVCSGSLCGAPIAAKLAKSLVAHTATDIDRMLMSVANELRILRQLRHPNIVLFHGATLANGRIVLILEKVKGQMLNIFVHQHMDILWRECLTHDLLAVIWYLHSREPPVVHGDIKSSNMMVEVRVPGVGQSFRPHLKLLDFGLSRILGAKPQTMGGTPPWKAPELGQSGNTATTCADMFSVGCAVFFILTTQMPLGTTLNVRPLPWPDGGIDAKYAPLCESCVSPVAEVRPSAMQAFNLFSQCLMTEPRQ